METNKQGREKYKIEQIKTIKIKSIIDFYVNQAQLKWIYLVDKETKQLKKQLYKKYKIK